MKTAFIFSGQGSQYPGMFRDLYERSAAVQNVFAKADEQLGRSISGLCFEGSMEELSNTQNTQPCVLAADLAAAAALKEQGVYPQGAAGFSLGEYAAAVIAGAVDMDQVFPLIQSRADAMQKAVPVGAGTMAAVIGLNISEIENICRNVIGEYVTVANYNAPDQAAVSGTFTGVEEVSRQVKQAGGMSIPLKVSGPFHCELMKPAAKKLKEKLETAGMRKPDIPMYFNFTGNVENNPEEMLLKQLYSPVQWVRTVENMYRDGFDTFIECGPGRVLSGLVKKILKGKEVIVLHVEDGKTLDNTCRKLEKLEK